jgi:hypothetical protein
MSNSWKPSARYGPVIAQRAAIYKPGQLEKVNDRKSKFDAVNQLVMKRGGWVISVPGADEVVVETLPESGLPAELRAMGYDLQPSGTGERILAGTIVEKMTLTSSGAFEPMTEGSTRQVADVRRHAGIVRVLRYAFRMD